MSLKQKFKAERAPPLNNTEDLCVVGEDATSVEAHVKVKMFCPFCGFRLEQTPTFCSSCGRDVRFLEDAKSASESTDEGCGSRSTGVIPMNSAVQDFMKYRELKERDRRAFFKTRTK
ncbi:hypothetical protein NFI96_006299 [Prochilodus magdalenae]|nr:hypothetical protein NFI96_006299 [Prochilodus magdalenae]